MLRGDSVIHFRSDAALNVDRQHAISKEIIIHTIGKYTQPNRVFIVVSQLCIVLIFLLMHTIGRKNGELV
jgi:hypothetical protein